LRSKGSWSRFRRKQKNDSASNPILWESGIGSDVMKPIAAPIVGGMITSTIHVLILVPVFFVMMKERALKRGTLVPKDKNSTVNDSVVQLSS
jgi:hypothetical protein